MVYWRRVNELAVALGQEPVFPVEFAIVLSPHPNPFSCSFQGSADLAEDSAEPTWQSSNVLQSRLLWTRLECPAHLLPRAWHYLQGIQLQEKESILTLASSTPFPWNGDFKMARQANALQNQRLVGSLHCSCPRGGPHSWHQPQACPLLCLCLGLSSIWAKETFKIAASYWGSQSSQAFICYEGFS